MEITPLTVTIDFDYPARKEYEEIYIPFTVVMKDGTKYKTTESGFNTIFYGDVMGKNLAMNISKPLDIDEIDYVDIAGQQYKVQQFFSNIREICGNVKDATIREIKFFVF